MPKFIIRWDAGYGPSTEVVEADNLDKAEEVAYERWRDEVEGQSDYCSFEYTEENCDEYGVDFKDEGETK